MYKKISEYGIIGNLQSVAIVGLDGSIDWLCLPHIDSPIVFGSLLDDKKAGRFALFPLNPWDSISEYIPGTNILRTKFRTRTGIVHLTDFMPIPLSGREEREEEEHELYRLVEGIKGEVRVEKEKGLIVFIRYPEKGRVKTRLAQYLGDDLTLDLYKHFLVDILTMCRMIDAEIMIAYSISEQRKDEILFFSERYMHFCQKGDDLGQRMFHALCEAAERGCKKCILIGSDIPDLPAAIINDAYKALDSSDITLGPSIDGGYYLIGFCSERIDHRIFDKVKWGTASVLKDTLENIEKTGMSFSLLQEWSDIDDLYTLKRYYSRYKQRKKMFSTMEFLEHNKGILSQWLCITED